MVKNMENKDYFIYYPQEDILVVYSFEDITLREDTFYGFENACQTINQNKYFWDVDWHNVEDMRYKVLMSEYSEEEFIENFGKNERFFSFDYKERYTVKDVCEVLYENEFDQY